MNYNIEKEQQLKAIVEGVQFNEKVAILHDINCVEFEKGNTLLVTNSGYLYTEEALQKMREELLYLIHCMDRHQSFLREHGEGIAEEANAYRLALVEKSCSWHSEPKSKAAKSLKKSYVYLMLNKRNGYYKIGRSAKPGVREATLQAEEPSIELVHSFEAPAAVEKELHLKYAEKRVRGEWFRLHEVDVEYIRSLKGGA